MEAVTVLVFAVWGREKPLPSRLTGYFLVPQPPLFFPYAFWFSLAAKKYGIGNDPRKVHFWRGNVVWFGVIFWGVWCGENITRRGMEMTKLICMQPVLTQTCSWAAAQFGELPGCVPLIHVILFHHAWYRPVLLRLQHCNLMAFILLEESRCRSVEQSTGDRLIKQLCFWTHMYVRIYCYPWGICGQRANVGMNADPPKNELNSHWHNKTVLWWHCGDLMVEGSSVLGQCWGPLCKFWAVLWQLDALLGPLEVSLCWNIFFFFFNPFFFLQVKLCLQWTYSQTKAVFINIVWQ